MKRSLYSFISWV